MTRMDDFNINELMLFIVGVLGALGGLCVIIQKSKCKKLPSIKYHLCPVSIAGGVPVRYKSNLLSLVISVSPEVW